MPELQAKEQLFFKKVAAGKWNWNWAERLLATCSWGIRNWELEIRN
jgi:hypothetical protein